MEDTDLARKKEALGLLRSLEAVAVAVAVGLKTLEASNPSPISVFKSLKLRVDAI